MERLSSRRSSPSIQTAFTLKMTPFHLFPIIPSVFHRHRSLLAALPFFFALLFVYPCAGLTLQPFLGVRPNVEISLQLLLHDPAAGVLDAPGLESRYGGEVRPRLHHV